MALDKSKWEDFGRRLLKEYKDKPITEFRIIVNGEPWHWCDTEAQKN